MISDLLFEQIVSNFGFEPTDEQSEALHALSEFVFSGVADSAFMLRGYAGTGKTSIVGALVKTLSQIGMRTVLLAPTGRAAKVFSLYAGHPAYTIHKKIYRQKVFDVSMDNFQLANNLTKQTFYIVDEASMISNDGFSGFGTGRLLDDLVHFVYGGTSCRLIVLGDSAQLPPVGCDESPALQVDSLEGYGLQVTDVELSHVVRQDGNSGILLNATRLRQMINDFDVFDLPKFKIQGMPDVKVVPGNELIDALADCYHRFGLDETIVITRSNKRAIIYNNGIRNMVLDREEILSSGDLLMVAKNNYYWIKPSEKDSKEPLPVEFIANGDVARVRRVRNQRELYGFTFVDVELELPDYDDFEFTATMLLDTLTSESPSLTTSQNEQLYTAILEDYQDIPQHRERMKKLKDDPYYNALQCKFAYAVTCHKAQGGQWQHVFLDQGYLTEDMVGPDYYRWLYTAVTRATDTLWLVNWRDEQME